MSAELVTSPVLTGAEAARARRIDLVGPVDDSSALTPTGPWKDEADKAFERARQEGHTTGMRNGYAEGRAEAWAEARADVDRMADALDTLGAQVEARVAAAISEMITLPRHPYTRMLIASLPSLDRKGTMQGIPGLAPLLRDLPPGCAFHPRCPLAEAGCRTERPEVRQVGESAVACHLA